MKRTIFRRRAGFERSTSSRPRSAPRFTAALAVLVVATLAAAAHPADRVPTPLARHLAVDVHTAGEVTFVVAEALPGSPARVGFYVTCKRGGRGVEAGFSFGAFPAGKPVRAAVQTPDGGIERFGPLVQGGPESGFHSPVIRERLNVRRFTAAAFRHGSLVSNGHNSVWNELGEPLNRRVRAAVDSCLDAK